MLLFVFQSDDGHDPYICKILEIFEVVDGLPYFRAQWYYRPVDTVSEVICIQLVFNYLAICCLCFTMNSLLF